MANHYKESRIKEFENKIGYVFSDKSLLARAFSHSSYTNENGIGPLLCNERLEFLGDAVLEAVVSDELYHRYPDMKEGELTKLRAKLVCEPSLATYAEKIQLKEYILLGNGEEKTGGRERKSIIADCMEAVIGAIYIDSGMEAARKYIEEFILFDIEHATYFQDYKTKLQEVLQARGEVPSYCLVSEEGPAHAKVFTMKVEIGGESFGTGSANTKKQAEQMAAKEALDRLE